MNDEAKESRFGRRVNHELRVELAESGLTSHAGLELLIRCLRRIDFNGLIRQHLNRAGGRLLG